MARLSNPRAKVRPRLEIIPFIDVMFFLLATFMMVSLSMIHNSGVEVKLPKMGSSQRENKQPEEFVVSLDQQGQIFASHDPVNLAQLRARLTAWQQAEPEGRVVLQGDSRCDFGKVAEVMDTVRLLGIERLLIRTEKAGKTTP